MSIPASAAGVTTATAAGADPEFCQTATGEVGGRRCWPVSPVDLVCRQGGVLALRQAVARGMSAAKRAREGAWRRLHPAVYLLAGHRLTDEARVRAAWGWAGEGAVVSGPAAAYWHGMLEKVTADRRAHGPARELPAVPGRRAGTTT